VLLVTEGRIPRGSNKYRCEVISCIPKEAIVGMVKMRDVGGLLSAVPDLGTFHAVKVGQSYILTSHCSTQVTNTLKQASTLLG